GEARVFDKASTGLIMSEGAALLGLTTLKNAKAKNLTVYGEITSFAFRSFPNDNIIAPTENGFVRTFNDLYANAPVARSQVRYIDGFASSNKVVDKWELTALNKTFRKNTFLGNVKPEIGYYRSANPAVVIAKLVMMAKNRTILPIRSYNAESSMLDGKGNIIAATERVNLAKGEPLVMAANFSGLGGLHGHAVVRTIPAWIEGAASGSVRASAYASAPTQSVSGGAAPMAAKGARVCALLSGQGAQSAGMMKSLYSSNATIKSVLDRGEAIFRAERGYSILDMMFGDDAKLNSTENTQVAVFLSTAAIYDDLASKGFAPDMFIGHSVGEYSALYCAGVLSFEAAIKLIINRSAIMKSTADEKKGVIMVVFADADATDALVKRSGVSNVWIANKNSLKQTAVSGSAEGIDAFAAFLKNEKITFNKLNLSGAFHSPLFSTASEKIAAYMANLSFNGANFAKIISNVTAKRYPGNESEVKTLLMKQVASPVEFVNSVKYAVSEGMTYFVEVGPNKLLSNLLRDIPVGNATVIPTVDLKAGEAASFEKACAALADAALLGGRTLASGTAGAGLASFQMTSSISSVPSESKYVSSADFDDFLAKNREKVTQLLHAEYEKHKREKENEFFKRSGFYGGSVVISGASVGLPGRAYNVFDEKNFERILSGMNLIEPIDEIIKKKIVDRNIVRVHKDPQGNAKFLEIKSTDEVIQLAGQLGYFDKKEYGIEFANDQTYDLAIAAGIEALKDAKIPLVQQFEKTSVGSSIAKGYALPTELQERTGVIFTAVFSGIDTLVDEFERYAGDKFYRTAYAEFEKMFQFLMANVKEEDTKRTVTDWFVKLRELTGTPEKYVFNRNILFNILSMGNAYLAQMIKAKGPNSQTNAACASTTQAIGIAEDWIRTGRCDRVIVIAGEAATSNLALPLLGAGFLSLGAATVKKVISEAAKPFDADRNGLIVGSGAIGVVVEREDCVKDRGFKGQAEILGVHIKNSAFHGSRLDVNHVAGEMKKFIERTEYIHDMTKNDYTSKLVFMSHETYTPARGGSADAEVYALKNAFPDDYRKIKITNTKGYTGHTLSAGIEDAVLVKALQYGIAAPIANLVKIQDSFSDLNFSKGERGDYQYGIHFAAGFGSQFAILFIRKINEVSAEGNETYKKWLSRISGSNAPTLGLVNKALAVTNSVSVAKEPVKAHVGASAPAVQPVVAQQKGPSSTAVVAEIKKLIADMTGYGIEMLDSNLDLEGDLGIDTVKQVEIFGKICEKFAIAVPEDLKLSELNTIDKLGAFISAKTGATGTVSVSPAAPAGAAPQAVGSEVKKIIADMTGYGIEMLDENLDLEGDLGIDTVKQVEIFGKICEKFAVAVPEDLKLSELNTIAKLSAFMADKAGIASAPAAASVSAQPGSGGKASAKVTDDVKNVIAEMTGYGIEMLDENLDLEGDLGIDTVKQV
ncbi:MAG TPA: acyltransferase domain-containing protein, partial [Spirochaetota bacterium]